MPYLLDKQFPIYHPLQAQSAYFSLPHQLLFPLYLQKNKPRFRLDRTFDPRIFGFSPP